MEKEILVHSLRGTQKLEFDVLLEAIDSIPHAARFRVPKDMEMWLKQNCESNCYLISEPNRSFMSGYYIVLFSDPADAIHTKLYWG